MFYPIHTHTGQWSSVEEVFNSILTGLVGITAGCGVVDSWAAVVIGIVSAWLYVFTSKMLLRWKIDDVVGSFPVHGVGGWWGTIAVALFAKKEYIVQVYHTNPTNTTAGIFYGGLLCCVV